MNFVVKQRFEGEGGQRLLVEALKDQKIVDGNENLAREIARKVQTGVSIIN